MAASPRRFCRLRNAAGSFAHGTWNAGGTIVFAANGPGLWRVSAAGGDPALVPGTASNEFPFWPEFLPDGQHFLFLRLALQSGGQPDSREQSEVMLGSLDGDAPVSVMRALSKAIYLDPGYLLFVREGTLLAQPFDPGTLRLRGEPAAVADGVMHFRRVGFSDFSVSRNGLLAFQTAPSPSRLRWLTRDGSEAGAVGEPSNYVSHFRVSPDGQRLVAARSVPGTGTADLWLLDFARGTETRFTSSPVTEWSPVWSPEGRQVLFAADVGGPPFLHVKRIGDGSNWTPLVASTGTPQLVCDWSDTPSGPFIIYEDTNLVDRPGPRPHAHVGRAQAAALSANAVRRNRRAVLARWTLGGVRFERVGPERSGRPAV